MDDHVIIRRGLRNLITQNLVNVTIVDAPDLASLFQVLEIETFPDLVILDLQVPDGNAMDHIKQLRTTYPETPILVYSVNAERLYGPVVLELGCAGFLSKNAPEEEVLHAVDLVLEGGVYIGHVTQERMRELNDEIQSPISQNPFDQLSSRELRVLEGLMKGNGVKEIAVDLGLGVSTVGTYKARLFDKLGITNLMELETIARLHGFKNKWA